MSRDSSCHSSQHRATHTNNNTTLPTLPATLVSLIVLLLPILMIRTLTDECLPSTLHLLHPLHRREDSSPSE